MQATMTSPRGLRRATAIKLLVVLGIVIVLAEGAHLYALSATRLHARAVLAQTLNGITASYAKTVTAALDAFDRMTSDIFFAAAGPYLVLAMLIPCVIVNLTRLQSNLAATKEALKALLKNHSTNNGALCSPASSLRATDRA